MSMKLSRRNFIGLGATAAAGTAFAGLAGCARDGSAVSDADAGGSAAAGKNTETAGSVRDVGTASFEINADIVKASETNDVDVVVVGSGISGFAAALTVAEGNENAKVVLLEKNGTLGGSTNYAECPAGARPFEYTEAEARAAAAEAQASTQGVSNPMLLYRLFADAKENFGWLFDMHGVKWTKQGQAPAFYEGGNGTIAIQTLAADAEMHANLTLLTKTPATQLLVSEDGYAVTGIRCKTIDGDYVDYNAKAVVLATGGLSTNKALLANYSSQDMEKIIGWGEGQDGDGQLMAEQTAHGRANHITVDSLFNNVQGFAYDSPLGACVGMQPTDFWVNEDGLRFMSENIASTAVSGKVVECQGSVWSILDADAVQRYADGGCQRHYSGFADPLVGNKIDGLQDEIDKYLGQLPEECFKADTVAELAVAIGVDEKNLQAEVDAYNTGTDAEWGKESENMWAVKTAPFYAFRISSGMVNTSGGIRINTNAQVTDARGKVISGLYAAGVCTSGWDGEVYGNGTCQAAGLWAGRAAAKHIVANVL
ncbi:FAD-binding protein [Slackia exigua]|uniref:FAD-binding protein n=1 Tax=Slackia exigua TaxID=84109 RepID=UPI003AB95089